MKLLVASEHRDALSLNIVRLCKAQNIDTIFSADPVLQRPFFSRVKDARAYEEYMYARGALNAAALKKDTEALLQLIHREKPEVILAIERPAALIAAQVTDTPVWAFVHPSMYRNIWFPAKVMKGLNETLSAYGLEQELSLASLYAKASRRIGFGPLSASPYPEETQVSRLGMMFEEPLLKSHTDRVVIHGLSRYRKLIEETFLHAPYPVVVTGAPAQEKNENIQYVTSRSISPVPGSDTLIHNGTSYLSLYAMMASVPQIVIGDHTPYRSWNALAVKRCHAGTCLFEEDLNVASLYEAYQALHSDPSVHSSIQDLRRECRRYGSLKEIVDLLYIDLIAVNEQ